MAGSSLGLAVSMRGWTRARGGAWPSEQVAPELRLGVHWNSPLSRQGVPEYTEYLAQQAHRSALARPDAVRAAVVARDRDALTHELDVVPWEQTVQLPLGVVTPGAVDFSSVRSHYGVPGEIEGARVLDLNPGDGYWAFEFERRNAIVSALRAPKVSDLDLPAWIDTEAVPDRPLSAGFALAHAALDSVVQEIDLGIGDLDIDSVGCFDVVHCRDVLAYRSDPVGMVQSIRSVTKQSALFSERVATCTSPLGRTYVHTVLGIEPGAWFIPTVETLTRQVLDGGFSRVEVVGAFGLHSSRRPVRRTFCNVLAWP